jgi:integrase
MKIYLMVRKGQSSKKSLENGKSQMNSLYLTYHDVESKVRNYEFLKLYLYDKPKNFLEKEHNTETQLLAEAIRAQKILDYQSRKHGFVSSVSGKIGFIEYFKQMTDKKCESKGNWGNWLSTYKHLNNFCKKKDIQISKIDDLFLESFKIYLLTAKISSRGDKLSQNSALSYFNKVRTALKEAYYNKMIKENPFNRVKGIKEKETNREYLTLDELKKLVKTDCNYPILKDAFLFSSLTGLRFSDIKTLKWRNISYDSKSGYLIKFTQQKTKGTEHLPVCEQAIFILGERKKDDDLVFENLIYSAYHNKILHKWVEESGVEKHITFHSARHTFATLQLTMNTDIYTVSKLLGHRHLKTTEIYAKVIDTKKISAVANMPNLNL